MSLAELLRGGVVTDGRGGATRELRNHVLTLRRPTQRFLFLPGRGNDPFAAVAETLWVLAGRDDVRWLERYLPRAGQFSDDGRTWRAAYGPRLRAWGGVDPLREVVRLLLDQRTTRRAVLSMFDPERDYGGGLDVPCTNWLTFLVRDDRLHLTVGMRSNDVWWGFSGINAFEWSVLQQMVAAWVRAEVGELTFVASSFHLYDRHHRQAGEVLNRFRGVTCYQHGLDAPTFTVELADLDRALDRTFEAERQICADPWTEWAAIGDPFLDGCLGALQLKHAADAGVGSARLAHLADRMPDSDMKAAALAWLCRRLDRLVDALAAGPVKSFVSEYLGEAGTREMRSSELEAAIASLHRRKDRAYQQAWKKRGEARSILPNIARKVDRLTTYAASGAELDEESLLDTAVDLLVYVLKYRLYLLDQGMGPSPLFAAPTVIEGLLSDGPEAFDEAVGDVLANAGPAPDVASAIEASVTAFEHLDHHVADGGDASAKARLVDDLLSCAAALVLTTAAEHTIGSALFLAQERQRSG